MCQRCMQLLASAQNRLYKKRFLATKLPIPSAPPRPQFPTATNIPNGGVEKARQSRSSQRVAQHRRLTQFNSAQAVINTITPVCQNTTGQESTRCKVQYYTVTVVGRLPACASTDEVSVKNQCTLGRYAHAYPSSSSDLSAQPRLV